MFYRVLEKYIRHIQRIIIYTVNGEYIYYLLYIYAMTN